MEKFDIVTGRKYTKDGVEKTAWRNVGTLTKFPANGEKEESYALELHMWPDTKYSVFKQKPREGQPQEKSVNW